ncbi:unnamed protein product [Ranitomeya imitator]|uniref:VWFD domain-containing protein n=1 Tax=Ranitomeya imitator TaxID=111125 RepID=A0ABN9LCY9_9NEOB|nr:unnamed protein product [Ranitomeya imitator]
MSNLLVDLVRQELHWSELSPTECEVDLKEIVTFDGRTLGCSVSPSHCYTVIAQDCTDKLRFLIAMKKTGQGFSNFEMNVKLGSYDIIIYSDNPEEFRVLLNGMWLLLKNDTYTNEQGTLMPGSRRQQSLAPTALHAKAADRITEQQYRHQSGGPSR